MSGSSRLPETPTPTLDPENPWPGLAPFDEGDAAFFFGRAEAEEVLRLFERQRLTLLFGLSGLGKTSLIRAGVFPRLREKQVFPIAIRLDHSSGVLSLSEQVRAAIAAEAVAKGVQAPVAEQVDSLWQYFHREGAEFRDPRNQPLVPLLFLDQFEEVFTLGRASSELARQTDAFLTELADLIEGRPPAALKAQLNDDPEDARQYSFSRHTYRILISMREDFLADLEDLRSSIPSIVQNRFRVVPMDGRQAVYAVSRSGGHLFPQEDGGAAPSVAERVVRFVGSSQVSSGTVAPLEELHIEPALLSLFCRELNLKRQRRGEPHITADLLEGARSEILTEFYERSTADLDPQLRVLIEERLLTPSGHRESIALETAIGTRGVSSDAILHLVDRRLLRLEERGGVARVEITHDVLTAVIQSSRDHRRKHEAEARAQAELRESQEAERDQRLRREVLERRATVRIESEAERAFHKARRALGYCLIVPAVLLVAMFKWHEHASNFDEALTLAVTTLPLLLNRFFGLRFAGRVFWPCSTVVVLSEPPSESWDSVGSSLFLAFGVLPLAVGIGWLIDLSARRPARARRLLPLSALLLAWLSYLGDSEWPTYLGLSVMFLWPWIEPRLGLAPRDPEVQSLFDRAAGRWIRRRLLRGLAAALVLLPVFLFLSHSSLPARVRMLVEASPLGRDEARVYFLRTQGRLLVEEDFQRYQIYVLPDEATRAPVDRAFEDVEPDQGEQAFSTLSERLAPHRVTSGEMLLAAMRTMRTAHVVRLDKAGVRRTKEAAAGSRVFPEEVWQFSTQELEERLLDIKTMQWPLAALAAVAFLFLWRRGDDSPVAFWIALTLIGMATPAPEWYSGFQFDAVRFRLWVTALQGHSLFKVLADAPLAIATVIEWAATRHYIPMVAVWVHLCWPTAPGARRRLRFFRNFTVVAAILSLVLEGVDRGVTALVAERASTDRARWIGEVVRASVVVVLALGVGAWMRRRRAALSEVPRLRWSPIAAFATLVALSTLVEPDPRYLMALRVPLTTAFCFFVGHAVFRFNFLEAGGLPALRYVLFLAALLAFGPIGDLSDQLLASATLQSRQGSTILTIGVLLGLFLVFQRLLRRLSLYVVDPRLGRLGRLVQAALESLSEREAADSPPPPTPGGIRGAEGVDALLYMRGPHGSFHLHGDQTRAGPIELVLTERFRHHLVGRGEPIDLRRATVEWEDFFHATEIAYLASLTRCRYLAPIHSSGFLQGLLFVPDADDPSADRPAQAARAALTESR